jgi:ribonuclease Z
MELTLLGTGNPLPDANRAGAATLLRAGATILLIDAGRGVVLRLAAAGVLPIQLSAVLLTHLHSDHICDLNDVVTTHWVMSQAPRELRIVGPRGTAEVVDGMLAMLRPDVRYRLAHHPDLTWEPQLAVEEVAEGVVLDEDGVRVLAAPTDHRPVEPTVGYRVEHGGRAIVLAGDTVPCDGLDRLCAGADAQVQTVLREDLVRAVPVPRFQDTIDYHSTLAQAAGTAARNRVARLVLTHQIPSPAPDAAEEWIALVREAGYEGEVVWGEDGTTLTV